jgi:hypothetical protein
MPKDMMSFKERAAHLVEISKSFNEFPNTAKWIRYLAETILLPNVTFGEVDYALKELLGAFRTEYIGSDENANYRERCYNAYFQLIWSMVTNKGYEVSELTFERLITAFQSGSQTLINILEIYQALVASKDLSEKQRYYGFCFLYLIFIEGLYDENMRILYSIKKLQRAIKLTMRPLRKKLLENSRAN